MAVVEQRSLFSWRMVQESAEMERFRRVRDVLPDGKLTRALVQERRKHRDDYPLEAMWNALLAGIVFQHPSRASLMRELGRNGELREECGFDPAWGEKAVPPKWVWTRFFKKLRRHVGLVTEAMTTAATKGLRMTSMRSSRGLTRARCTKRCNR